MISIGRIHGGFVIDVLVLGAGASGLAAAGILTRAGLQVRVLEARNRIGGRILTSIEPNLSASIELGAEFVHGAPRETLDLVNAHGLGLYDVIDSHFMRRAGGQLKAHDANWERVAEIFAQLRTDPKRDRSLAKVIASLRSRESRKTLALVQSFAEGFHAGNIDELSEVGLARAEQATPAGAHELDHSANFRLFNGYFRIPEILFGEIVNPDSTISLNRRVHRVEWSENAVLARCIHQLTGTEEVYRARAVIITLPVGVLASGAVEFSPHPPRLARALEAVRMGSAVRMTFRFRHRFWEGCADAPIGMIHGEPTSAFPTWWTTLPLRSPLITGWAGGPRALEMYSLPLAKRTHAALESLGALFDLSVRKLSADLQSVHHHDWQHDPFTLGAYSWVAVGGSNEAARFHRPISDTLYFAGEATTNTASRGTVDGAISSGHRAAHAVLGSAPFAR
jgi:monoamine oxidase